MNILSLFDGISCGQIALQKAEMKVDNYFSSEIDKHTIKVTQHNFPNTIQLGDITKVKARDLPTINLVIGGSPCQGFSFAGKGLNFKDPRSKLFFEYVRILKECNPKYFLLENVVMKKEYENVISELLNCSPILINSSLVSAQNRKRLYWTNIPFKIPENKNINWGNIRENDAPKNFYYTEKGLAWIKRHSEKNNKPLRIWGDNEKCQMIEANHYKNYSAQRFFGINDTLGLRYITPLECERAQTIPDDYTKYGLENHYQLFNFEGNEFTICNYAESKTVINPSQAKQLNYAISTIIDYLGMEIQNYPELSWINLKNVALKAVSDTNKQISASVLCTLKDGNDTEQQNFLKELITQKLNVNFVLQKSVKTGHWECAVNTIKCGNFTETLYIQNQKDCTPIAEDISDKQMVLIFIERLLKRKLGENLSKEQKLSITLTLINLIITQTIWKSLPKHSTRLCINSSIGLQGNLLELNLSCIEMENTTLMSDTSRYRSLGNGWTVDVIAEIFKAIERISQLKIIK